MPFPIAAAVAAGASLLGSGGQIYASGKMNKKTREWNEMMYERQRADALADWQMQNEYNSIPAQMSRLKAAGLNPNLVYDNGATYQSGAVRSTDVKSWNPETPNVQGLTKGVIEGIGAYQDWTLQQEQVKNMVAQRQNMELDSVLKSLEAAGSAIKNSRSQLELDQARRLYDTTIATAEERLRNLSAKTDVVISKEVRDAAMHAPNLAAAIERVANLDARTRLSKQQLENLKGSQVLQQLEINLRKLGLTYNDSIIVRALAQFAGGQSLPDLVKNLWSKVQELMGNAAGHFKDEVTTTATSVK